MKTETSLTGSGDEIRLFASKLIDACDKADESDELQHVYQTLEQATNDGPWRLLIHIFPKGR